MPKTLDGKVYRRVCIMLTADTIDTLSKVAKVNGLNKSETVRKLIDGEDVERHEEVQDDKA